MGPLFPALSRSKRTATAEDVGRKFEVKLAIIHDHRDLLCQAIRQGAMAVAGHALQHDEIACQAVQRGVQEKSRRRTERGIPGIFARLVNVFHYRVYARDQLGGNRVENPQFPIQQIALRANARRQPQIFEASRSSPASSAASMSPCN